MHGRVHDFLCILSNSREGSSGAIWLVHTDSRYRIAGKFRGVLIFVIFVVELVVTTFSTYEN